MSSRHMTTSSAYSKTAIALHWIMAIFIFAVFPLGVYMHELPPSPARTELYQYHKWIGLTVLSFATIRLLWRMSHRPPTLPASISRWQQKISHSVHHALYLLLILIPLSGWMMSSAKGYPTIWFNLIALPDLVGKDKFLADFFQETHEILNFTLLGLVVLHILAALKHHFFDRDGILARMLPFLTK